MTITDFVSVIESRPFDESKHVNFTLGMLLGTEEFQQEFAYLSGQDRRRSRQQLAFEHCCFAQYGGGSAQRLACASASASQSCGHRRPACDTYRNCVCRYRGFLKKPWAR